MTVGFPYVDFFHKPDESKGDRRLRWARILSGDAYSYADKWRRTDCFTTIQTFPASLGPNESDIVEVHYAPLYADFDSEDIEESRRDMLKLVRWATEEMELDEEDVRVWFSGKKGFHVLLNPTAFNVEAHDYLTTVIKMMMGHLKAYLDAPTLDMSVYTKRRMWRMENTRHSATMLYKVRLDHDQITMSEESLRELATEPGPYLEGWTPREWEIPKEFLNRFWLEWELRAELDKSAPVELHMDAAPGDPVCVQDIETNGLKKPGDRNKGTLVLASYYKDAGRSEAEARASITDWALRLPAEHRRMDNSYIKANTTSVISSVYHDDGYKFGCNFIRSLHGDKSAKDYERVACMGDDCPFVKAIRAPETIHEIHLSSVGDPEFIGRPVRLNLRIAGRVEQPYIVPRRIAIRAFGLECERMSCSLHAAGGVMTKDFSSDERLLISMCSVPDNSQELVIKKHLAQTMCKAYSYTVMEFIKIVELACVPKAESAIGVKGELAEGTYTYQRAYALGDETEFPVNSYYSVTGRVHAHPKNQAATLFITGATPLQDVIEDFDLPTARPILETYSAFPSESAKLGHLLADVAVNIAKVAGRRVGLMGLLMTMHSPLYLDIEGERYGGWMQSLVVGDTGEAKSQVVERVLRYVGLGDLVNAQNAGRTGLLYTIVNKDSMLNFIQWGAFVLNDRRLLVVDEASGLDKLEYAELRNARRDGVFKVSRSVTGEAQTRTRLIMLSNPRFGKNMRDYTNGIEAVTHLFENADIRRFDLVMGFRNGSVSHDQIEVELSETVPVVFTAQALRTNMLWAWSRTPEDIVWAEGTLSAVKATAKRLNKTYEGSGVHLLSQDAVEKLARMSQALAATLHSTDFLHQKIVVLPEHVGLVEEMIESLYSAPDLEYDSYVRQNREGDTTDYEDLGNKIGWACDRYGVDAHEVLSLFSRTKVVNNFALEAICGETKTSRQIAREFFKIDLIKPGRNGYERTPTFNEYLRRWHRASVTA